MFEFKRFMAFIAAGLLLIAAKYYPTDLQTGVFGQPVYFDEADRPVAYGSAYSFVRADCEGGQSEAARIMKKLRTEIKFVEKPEGETIYYCYSPRFARSVVIGVRKVNLAVVVRGNNVTVASPLPKGGY